MGSVSIMCNVRIQSLPICFGWKRSFVSSWGPYKTTSRLRGLHIGGLYHSRSHNPSSFFGSVPFTSALAAARRRLASRSSIVEQSDSGTVSPCTSCVKPPKISMSQKTHLTPLNDSPLAFCTNPPTMGPHDVPMKDETTMKAIANW